MRTLQLIHGEAGRKAQTGGRDSDFFSEKTGILVEKTVCEFISVNSRMTVGRTTILGFGSRFLIVVMQSDNDFNFTR